MVLSLESIYAILSKPHTILSSMNEILKGKKKQF